MILQILTILFLVFFLSKPVLSFQGITGRPIVIIIDSSASMGTKDLLPNRFERAKIEVLNLLSKFKNRVTLIVAKDRPVVLISSGRREDIEKALKREKLFLGEGNLNYAIAYAENLFKNLSCDIYIFTDGSEKLSISKDSSHNYYIHVIGKKGDNVGILDGRVFQKNNRISQVFLKIGNFSESSKSFNIRLLKDGNTILTTKLALNPREIKTLTFEVPLLVGKIEAYLDLKDELLEDNRAYFYVPNFSPKVLIISMGNPFLEKAVRSISSSQVEIRRDIVNVEFNKYDFCIFDGLIPYSEIPGNFLFIGGYPGLDPKKIEKIGKIKILSWEEHPILRFVQLYGITVDNAYLFKDESLKPLIYSNKGPVGFYY
ncbi:MAG: vWA domain-containing protein, partial [Dictyoglomus sp.]